MGGNASSDSGNRPRAWMRGFFSREQDGRYEHVLEIVAAALLSLTTVVAAWCGYQAARWGGEQARYYSEATAKRTEAAKYENQALLRSSIQIGLFVQYVVALSRQEQKLADFMYVRFPPELKTATDAWLKTRPLKNPDAPKSPFEMPEYTLRQQIKAQEAEDAAERKAEAARAANALSDKYVLLTVILTSVLFLGGISGKFKWRSIKAVLLTVGIVVLLSILGILLKMPVY